MPLNPFDRHGIKHLSASSLNLYRNEPALWVLRYLKGMKDESGPAAWRGSAVEAGVDLACMKPDAAGSDCFAHAMQTFENNAAGEVSDDIQKERAAISDFLAQATNLIRPLGVPLARQIKIEYWLDGIEVPLIGYVDYSYETQLIDLKTTWRLPSEPRDDHAMQVAIYHKATGKRPFLAYATPKKSALYEVTDIDSAIGDAYRAAKAIRTLLNSVETADDAAHFFAPNFGSFYWNESSKAHALTVWAQPRPAEMARPQPKET